MTRTLKNGVVILFASVLVCMVTAMTALAAGGQDEVLLEQQGSNVNVSIDGIKSDVSAFSLTLEVDTTADAFDAVGVEFSFSDAISHSTKIHRVTYDKDASRSFVNIYVAGGNDLFAQRPLSVGTIALSLDTAKSPGAVVDVKLPEGGALTTVTSGFEEEDGEMFLQATSTLNLGDVSEIEPPTGGNDGSTGGSNGDQVDENGNRIPAVQPIEDGSSPSRGSATAGDLARTGDQTPIIPIVLVALACIALIGAVFFFRRNADKSDDDK